jgi:hypothetical protein
MLVDRPRERAISLGTSLGALHVPGPFAYMQGQLQIDRDNSITAPNLRDPDAVMDFMVPLLKPVAKSGDLFFVGIDVRNNATCVVAYTGARKADEVALRRHLLMHCAVGVVGVHWSPGNLPDPSNVQGTVNHCIDLFRKTQELKLLDFILLNPARGMRSYQYLMPLY